MQKNLGIIDEESMTLVGAVRIAEHLVRWMPGPPDEPYVTAVHSDEGAAERMVDAKRARTRHPTPAERPSPKSSITAGYGSRY